MELNGFKWVTQVSRRFFHTNLRPKINRGVITWENFDVYRESIAYGARITRIEALKLLSFDNGKWYYEENCGSWWPCDMPRLVTGGIISRKEVMSRYKYQDKVEDLKDCLPEDWDGTLQSRIEALSWYWTPARKLAEGQRKARKVSCI
jgi:hypothetical protein